MGNASPQAIARAPFRTATADAALPLRSGRPTRFALRKGVACRRTTNGSWRPWDHALAGILGETRGRFACGRRLGWLTVPAARAHPVLIRLGRTRPGDRPRARKTWRATAPNGPSIHAAHAGAAGLTRRRSPRSSVVGRGKHRRLRAWRGCDARMSDFQISNENSSSRFFVSYCCLILMKVGFRRLAFIPDIL